MLRDIEQVIAAIKRRISHHRYKQRARTCNIKQTRGVQSEALERHGRSRGGRNNICELTKIRFFEYVY